jgi:glutathione S-transferase
MGITVIVLVLVLMQYSFFGIKVGMARVNYNIQAPAISGHPVFERYYRVHQNTLEQLLVFAVMAEGQGWMGSELAAACGVLWIIGRFIYASAYIEDPAKRGMGFMLSFLATVLLMMGNLAAAIISLLG